ncbi:MAG: HEAT repeat domain-containing protein [Planctomycetaceae bacterium]
MTTEPVRPRAFLRIAAICTHLIIATTSMAQPAPPPLSTEERTRLVKILEDAVSLHESWIAIHAADALGRLNRPEPVLKAFREQANSTTAGYRVGVWRVLARAEPSDAAQKRNIDRIRRVLLTPGAADRVHAMEALAKLAVPIGDDEERAVVRTTAMDSAEGGAPFALWRLAQAGEHANAVVRLTEMLTSKDEVIRLRTAYVLARLRPLPAATQRSLAGALAAEPLESPAKPFLVCAVGGDAVIELAQSANAPAARYTAAMELAEQRSEAGLGALRSLVDDPDADVRVAAAFALLRRDGTRSSAPASTETHPQPTGDRNAAPR